MELIDKAKMMHYKALFEKHMSDPVKLRLTTLGGLLVLSIAVIYMPLSREIKSYKKLFSAEKERSSCIIDNEKLQKQADMFRTIIGDKTDTNEWVQYLLDGLRKFQVKLHGMESKPQKKVGPYKTVSFEMEIEGTYHELKNYVEWMESTPKLLRIDTLNFEKHPDKLIMKIIVNGVVPK